MTSEIFWLSSLSNLVATLVGIIVGLPAALWLDRVFRRRSEKAATLESKRRARKILTILEGELYDNTEMMNHFHEDIANSYYPVRTESWDALSDGGDLRWIEDEETIYHLSIAYARTRQFSFLYEKYVTAFYFPNTMGIPGLKQSLLQSVIKARDNAVTWVTISRNYINKQRELLSKDLGEPDEPNVRAATS